MFEALHSATPPLRPFSGTKRQFGAWLAWGTWAAAHLVTLKVTECLYGDGLERRLPAVLEGHHLLSSLLQALHHVLILVQSLLLVLNPGGCPAETTQPPPSGAGVARQQVGAVEEPAQG